MGRRRRRRSLVVVVAKLDANRLAKLGDERPANRLASLRIEVCKRRLVMKVVIDGARIRIPRNCLDDSGDCDKRA